MCVLLWETAICSFKVAAMWKKRRVFTSCEDLRWLRRCSWRHTAKVHAVLARRRSQVRCVPAGKRTKWRKVYSSMQGVYAHCPG